MASDKENIQEKEFFTPDSYKEMFQSEPRSVGDLC
jgi:hypothetical protein